MGAPVSEDLTPESHMGYSDAQPGMSKSSMAYSVMCDHMPKPKPMDGIGSNLCMKRMLPGMYGTWPGATLPDMSRHLDGVEYRESRPIALISESIADSPLIAIAPRAPQKYLSLGHCPTRHSR